MDVVETVASFPCKRKSIFWISTPETSERGKNVLWKLECIQFDLLKGITLNQSLFSGFAKNVFVGAFYNSEVVFYY